MELTRQLIKTFLVWLLILLILILIVLLPRTVQYEKVGSEVEREYQFTWSEYGDNIGQFFSGAWENKSLGQTRHRYTVEFELQHYMSRSIYLIVTAFLVSIPLGLLKGIYDYRKTHTRKNILGNGSTWFFQSIPDFFVVISVQVFFIGLYKMGFPLIPLFGYDHWYSFLTPSLMLSIYPIVYIARITSSALAAQEREQYIRTAQAKGLSERVILYKHAMGNCWGTILSHFSSLMLYILSNLLIIEYLMFYRGAAYRLYEAMGFYDGVLRGAVRTGASVFEAELVIGFSICFMFLVLLAQIISQFSKYYLDPRWRGDAK
jgi:oligopeptide transport system permease protein